MFFLSDLIHTVHLDPQNYACDISKTLEGILYSTVEGSCNGDSGFIIMVVKVTSIQGGRITHTGEAVFTVGYKALVLKPNKDEVIDAVIKEVNKLGVFCEVGPLTVFVSNYHIPSLMDIKVDGCVRLKVIGTKIELKRMYAIGTINEDHLGLIN